jgi:hypothetical protein
LLESWTDEQRDAFQRDGSLIVEESFSDGAPIERLRVSFDRPFAADYETRVGPDEATGWPAYEPLIITAHRRHPVRAAPGEIERIVMEHMGPNQPGDPARRPVEEARAVQGE